LFADSVNGVTTMEWRRLLSTGDGQQDQIINPAAVHNVLYAMNPTDKPLSSTVFAKHFADSRGVQQISFSQSSSCPVPQDVKIDIELNIDPVNFDENLFLNNLATHLSIPLTRIVVLEIIEVDPVFCPTCTVVDFSFPNYYLSHIHI